MESSENNIKDTKDVGFHFKDNNLPFSYGKTKKLITALFMVTDIMDKEEPLRNKFRDLGVEIMSDNYSISSRTDYISIGLLNKISLILSFLDIASDIQLISQMNSDILKKEFIKLKKSIQESIKNTNLVGSSSLYEFFKEEEEENNIKDNYNEDKEFSIGHIGQYKILQKNPIGHNKNYQTNKTRVGVQKGSTLLKALKEIETHGKVKTVPNSYDKNKDNLVKNTRREEITKILKNNPNGLTITEIKERSENIFSSVSEKTLQRELVDMVLNNVLYKTGSKRWSRYFIKN